MSYKKYNYSIYTCFSYEQYLYSYNNESNKCRFNQELGRCGQGNKVRT